MCDPAVRSLATPTLESFLLDPALEAQQRQFRPQSVLHHSGSPATHIYFIHEGQVRLYLIGPNGTERLVEIYGPGQWIGSEALAGSATHTHRVEVVETAVITLVPVDKLLQQLPNHPQVATELVRHLARKVQSAREDAARLVFDDSNARLLKILLRFSHSVAATPVVEGVVLHINHQQLAQAVGVARETISLALTQFRHRNLLQTGRNRLTFDPDVIRQFLEHHKPELQQHTAAV